MERKYFIEQVGLSAASILIFGCMKACSKAAPSIENSSQTGGSNSGSSNNKIDFTIY